MPANYTIPKTADPVSLLTTINTETGNYFGTAIIIIFATIFFFIGYKMSNSVSAAGLISGIVGILISLMLIAIGMNLWYPLIVCVVLTVVSGISLVKSD